MKRRSALLHLSALMATSALAQKQYDPGVSDTVIKIGNTAPYSGPASVYGTVAKTMAAYMRMVNDKGGVNGRKIDFISLDDGYSPPKTVEQVRRLIEQEQVLALAGGIGTPTSSAIVGYQNARKVPHLFMGSGAEKWNDPKGLPWSLPFQPSYAMETALMARYALDNVPNAKFAILWPNDDSGKEYEIGIREAFGNRQGLIAAQLTYQTSDPTVDSQVIQLASSGANVFFNFTHPKFAIQAIRKARELGWTPLQFLPSTVTSIKGVLAVAGLEISTGLLSTQYLKDPGDPRWKNDAEMKEWNVFMDKYYPDGSKSDSLNAVGYALAFAVVHTLRMAGDNITRENVMKQANSLKDVRAPMLLPGITLNTSATSHAPIEQVQMARFNGEAWELQGAILSRKH